MLKCVRIEHIEDVVCARLLIGLSDIHRRDRHKPYVTARAIIMASARKMTRMSLPELARYFGLKSHSTAHYAVACGNRHPLTREIVDALTADLDADAARASLGQGVASQGGTAQDKVVGTTLDLETDTPTGTAASRDTLSFGGAGRKPMREPAAANGDCGFHKGTRHGGLNVEVLNGDASSHPDHALREEPEKERRRGGRGDPVHP